MQQGVILYGVPGTGKTLLAKAVAHHTSATFLRVVGSELIQKYLGDGPKLVRELFRVADEHSPSIVFIDEIDAVGTKRYDCIPIIHPLILIHWFTQNFILLWWSIHFHWTCKQRP
jgi:ATP-dependent 26S proteasome regulatory subunit